MEQATQRPRLGRAVRFGVYEVDLATGELRKNGMKISLQDQPFQVLSLLLARPGELVTREELQKQVWPADTFVDFDLGLNTAIKKIREALDDSAKNPRFVETLPKRGYRFITRVEEIGCHDRDITATVHGKVDPEKPRETTATTIAASRQSGSRMPLLRRFWLGSAVIVLAIGVLSLRQFRVARNRDAAIGLNLKGWSYLNDAYDMPGRTERAIESFERAAQLDRDYAPAYAGLGEAYFLKFAAAQESQWAEKAEAACREALQLDKKLPAAFNCLGTVHRGRGRYEEAIEDFSRAIQLDSQNAAGFRGRAAAYQGRNAGNDLSLAEQDYLRAIELAPDRWRAYAALAGFYHNQTRDCEAVQQLKKAIALRPDNSEPLASLGALYIEMGLYSEATASLEKALSLFPSFAAYENLGTAYLDKRNFGNAVDSFKRALEFRSSTRGADDYVGHGNLARAYSWALQPVLARQEYERAIALASQQLQVNPKDLDANLSLAIYYASLGEREESRNQLDLALSLEPHAPETKFWAMIVELQLGNKKKALAWMPDALKYSPAEIKAAPELDSLRHDPVFQQQLESAAGHLPPKCL